MTRMTIHFLTSFSLAVEEVETLVASTTLAPESCGCGTQHASETPIKDDVTPVGEEPAAPVRWKGIIGVEGELTGDGRYIQPGALRWENLPIPLRYVSADVGAHSGAVVVGRIDKIERDEETGLIFGEGDFDMGSEVGREAMRQVKENLMRGVSMDLDDVAFEVRIAADAPALMAQDPVALVKEGKPDEDGRVKVQEMAPDDEVMVTTDARVRAATIVAVPAFSRAMLGMADDVDEAFDNPEAAKEFEEALVAAMTEPVTEMRTLALRLGGARFEIEYDALSTEDFNWVEDVGGLPEYIDKIADAIARTNPEMSQGHTIAIAVNAVKKMCATGDLNFPGDQDVNPGSQAKACEAVAEWEEKKARAKADSGETETFEEEVVVEEVTEPEVEVEAEWDVQGIVSDLNAKEEEGEFDSSVLDDEQFVVYVQDIYAVDADMAQEVVAAYRAQDDEHGEIEEEEDFEVILAAAPPHDPDLPPVGHFSNPNLKQPTALTVTPDGRVYGHLATWGTCHLTHTNAGKCVVPPKTRTNYAYFHTGSVMTKEGAEVPVGQITLNTRHANDRFKPTQALAHYDNTGLAVADVVAGEDAHGIWISGSLRPGVDAKAVRVLRASPLSGDWRRVGGNLELVAALAVNVPGFPVPRPRGVVQDGRMNTLVAAGMLPPTRVRRPGTKGALSNDDLRYLKRLAARERAQEQEEKVQTLSAVDEMAKRLRSTEKEQVLAAARRIKVQQMAARLRSGA